MSTNLIYIYKSGDAPYLLSPFGRTLSLETIELARTDRVASGRLVKDVVTTKKEITLQYSIITATDMEYYQTIYSEQSELILDIYKAPSTIDSYTVLMEPIGWTRLIADELYENVTVKFLEV
jgi:hypothetical protein